MSGKQNTIGAPTLNATSGYRNVRKPGTAELIKEIGSASVTLLKNTGSLPLKHPQRIAVLGRLNLRTSFFLKKILTHLIRKETTLLITCSAPMLVAWETAPVTSTTLYVLFFYSSYRGSSTLLIDFTMVLERYFDNRRRKRVSTFTLYHHPPRSAARKGN